jgi:RimJ/RimL family protein N-acetyltransferase
VPSIPFLDRPLGSDRVVVRDYAERDIPEILIAYQDDPQLHARIGREQPPSGAELGRLAEEESGERAAGSRATLTILQPGSDVFRGQLTVLDIDWEHRRAEIGIWMAPQARGRGMASAALRLASAWVFEAWGLERVAVLTEPDNEPMIRTARAAGFRPEGVLRGYTLERGVRVDNAVFSLLPGDLVR